ncbi:hypothetical protein B0A52_02854 [Exophiala mesophila]|uniref:Zn(2)-C6 fungal-type domain-containing protein n=1 Tax=Exophiala mesophila TaxID=212818 RepID=A0A438NDU7_EXOME|nr:hypothetical protein B0A52_02854 [Exophiala mesophila]
MGQDEEPSSSKDAEADRPVKKRASQACHHCRTRKVKCDLVKSGAPCHNCSTDGIECIVTESRRSRKFRLQKRQLVRPGTIPILPQTRAVSATFDDDHFAKTSSIPLAPVGSFRSPSSNDRDSPNVPQNRPLRNHSSPSYTPIPNPSNRAQSHHGAEGTPSNCHGSFATTNLPSYVRPPRPDFRSDDLDFLALRGALSVPDQVLRDQLIRSFVLHVYPHLPVIDLQEFLQCVDGSDPDAQMSLLLLQAVMFAGTAYIDIQYLQQAGFSDRRTARAMFYSKIKLLYDFDWEADRITLIQAILLHAYWYVSENDPKDPWHWLGVAISLGISIGLPQKEAYSSKDPKTRRLWRRLYWAIFVRDRIMAIATRKAMRFKEEDLTLSPLTLNDFDHLPITTNIRVLHDCQILNDARTRVLLSDLFIVSVSLMSLIGKIISNLYILQAHGSSTTEVIMSYAPKKSHINPKVVLKLQEELNQWERALPPTYRADVNYDQSQHNAHYLHTHRSILRLKYLLATETLHRPQTLLKRTPDQSFQFLQQKSRTKVREATTEMAELFESLQAHDLVRLLPPISISFLLPAIASFLVEIKSSGKGPDDLPAHHFHQCIRALLNLKDIWPIAESACFLVGQMITNSQIGPARTLGQNDHPLTSNEVSQDSRESSAGQNLASAMEQDMVPTNDNQRVQILEQQAEIPGIAVPMMDMSYSPGIIPLDPAAWNDPIPWTMSEFGFGDDFFLDDRELYIDPSMAAFHTTETYDGSMLHFGHNNSGNLTAGIKDTFGQSR